MSTRRPLPNYFEKHRPQGDSLTAKVARAQIEAAKRPLTLPRVKFLERPPLDDDKGDRP
jgi:hypothetical protein